MTLSPGTHLGSYEILSVLGAGGMGLVYRARDTRLGRDVALKTLPGDLAASPERLDQLRREARVVAGLNHPGIVTLYAFEEVEGIHFLTMELVEGVRLDEIIPVGGLPAAEVLDLLLSVGKALTAAHEKGVIHCDLKPANVIITPQRRAKVLDFGLARLSGTGALSGAVEALTRTNPGLLRGTLAYMAPEQLLGRPPDARVDLFAFGVLGFELAMGRRPFAGDSFGEIISAILRDPVPLLTDARADLPVELARIIHRCLEKEPANRYPTAAEMLAELKQLRRTWDSETLGVFRAGQVAAADVSIAVLPFLNMTRDAENDYFAEGLADELLNILSRVKRLRVAARTSSFQFKDRQESVESIGRQLRVRTLLEGSVRRAGSRVRITAQLIQVSDGFTLWGDTYDREIGDIFAVQDDIAHSVVKELRVALLGETPDSGAVAVMRDEIGRAVSGRSENPEAYRAYLQGRHLERRMRPDSVRLALRNYEAALALDPEFVLAWAGLASAHLMVGSYGWGDAGAALAASTDALERAAAQDPALPEVLRVRARLIRVRDWDQRGAEALLRTALEQAPGSVMIRSDLARVLLNLGSAAEALEHARRAAEDDPLNPSAFRALGMVWWNLGQFGRAENIWRHVRELEPEAQIAAVMLAIVLMEQGRLDEALAMIGEEPSEDDRLTGLALIHHARGDADAANAALEGLISRFGETVPIQIAYVMAFRNRPDAAFDWLERAIQLKDPGVTELLAIPLLTPLHADSRWPSILDQIGLGAALKR